MKGQSYLDVRDAFVNQTKYTYWCDICKRGPMYTKAVETECPMCGASIKLNFIDGEIVAEAIKKK